MKVITCALLLGIFLRHDSAFTVAQWTGWNPRSIFYVQGALLEILLLALLLCFIWAVRRDVWRSLGIAACGIGISEAALIAGCQAAIMTRPPANVTQCDHVTGLPISAATTTIYLLVLAWIAGTWFWKLGR